MMCWHRWSKWKTVEAYIGEYVVLGGTARVIVQERVCEKCNKRQIEKDVA